MIIISLFVISNEADEFPSRRGIFSYLAVSGVVVFILGFVLVFLSLKEKVIGKLKKFLLLTGACSSGLLVSVVLHNLFYALGVITENIIVLHYLFEALHVAFFLIGIFVCPIGFLIDAIGTAILLIKK